MTLAAAGRLPTAEERRATLAVIATAAGRARPYLAHVPAGVDWTAIIPPARLNYALWFRGTIVFRRFHIHKLTPKDWCSMATKFREQFIPKNVLGPLVQALMNGVVECDDRYTPPAGGRQGRCKHYRIGKAYRRLPVVAVELLRHIDAYRQRERDAVTDSVLTGLRNCVEQLEVLATAPYGDPVLDRIRIGDCWFVVCEQGRVHTPATNLARCYRQYVQLAGNELVSVDVGCSQPLLLGVTQATSAVTGVRKQPTSAAAASERPSRRQPAH